MTATLPRGARAALAFLVLSIVFFASPSSADEPSVQAARLLMSQQDFAAAAAMLETIAADEPDNAQAWMLLGLAYHYQGELDAALVAHLRAAEYPETQVRAGYNCACAYARLGKKDEAFEWLQRVHASGQMNLTGIALDQDLVSLVDDPRFAALLPTPEEYADPFSEDVVILVEWDGEGQGDQFGWIARNIGDVDGDGVHDVVTSAPTWGEDSAGRVYVYSSASGERLWTAEGKPSEQLGLGVEAAGDVNADGTPDVIAGAPGGDAAYVYSGRDGVVLQTFAARQSEELFGRKVAGVGDFDGDGHGDVMVGAPGNDEKGEDAGRVYVISGKDGSDLVMISGERAGDGFGSSGDGTVVDGWRCLVVGAPNAGDGNGGRTYVYQSESASLKPSEFDSAKFVVESDDTGASLGGMFVSVVGDVDGDGVLDVYASDWSNNAKGRSTGRVFVHSGKTGERLHTLTGETAGDGFGIGPADAGDVDGDGYDDLVIGAWQHGSAAPSGGKVYLFSGRDASLLATYTCKVPGETFGFDATGMGDVDGDGQIDLLLTSAWSAINGARSGRMFLISSGLQRSAH